VAATEAVARFSEETRVRLMVLLVSWEVWKERNTRIFMNEVSTAAAIAKRIHDEGSQWIDAGFTPSAAVWAFSNNAGAAQTSVL
jgi:uncharacterized protein YaeQ